MKVWFSRAVRPPPVKVTVSLSSRGERSDRLLEVAVYEDAEGRRCGRVGVVGDGDLEARRAVPVHATSPMVADGSGPGSGGISQPLLRMSRPSGQFCPFGNDEMGGMMSPQGLGPPGRKIGPWCKSAWPVLACGMVTVIWL